MKSRICDFSLPLARMLRRDESESNRRRTGARVESRRYENVNPLCRGCFGSLAGLLFLRSIHNRAGTERAVSFGPNERSECATRGLDFRQ